MFPTPQVNNPCIGPAFELYSSLICTLQMEVSNLGFILTFFIMLSFWMLLSGEFTFILLTSGVAASLLVAYLSHDLLIGKADIKERISHVGRFLRYLPWLMGQIVLANIDLIYRTLHPKMPIDPGMIRIKNTYKTNMAMVTLANSITLTPGTVTIDVTPEEFLVHAIAKEPSQGLLAGEMVQRVRRIGEVDV